LIKGERVGGKRGGKGASHLLSKKGKSNTLASAGYLKGDLGRKRGKARKLQTFRTHRRGGR